MLFAVVFGEVILALEESTASRDEYARKMHSINETMRYKGVPTHLQRRVHRRLSQRLQPCRFVQSLKQRAFALNEPRIRLVPLVSRQASTSSCGSCTARR